MSTYTLRITYLTSGRRVRVQNVRGLEWIDVQALVNVLCPITTLSWHATCETARVGAR